jgi:mannose-6-phosphate isomerase class I
MADCWAAPEQIRSRIGPFLGGADPLFGKHYPMGLETFFDAEAVSRFRVELSVHRGRAAGSLAVVYGCGASLVELWDELWYADIPKDVIQELARAGSVANLGEREPVSFGDFYKRSYFVEWPALNRVKRRALPEVGLFIDVDDVAKPRFIAGDAFRSAMRELAESPFRPRPWFFPGPWGGKFMQGHMGLSPDEPNFAWSFELIAPENGIVLEKDGECLECSFDCLMYLENTRVLGEEAARQFMFEWPIRFDYLDTIDGGNLSVQCHPRPDYIRQTFGETFTQDETYYISVAKSDARVYLGLKESCDAAEFREAVSTGARDGVEVDFNRYVHSVESSTHDLFLIPNGTVHCSGEGNLVLEISATPYIFTFKIYDYLRRDLQGNLRPINVDRAWDNMRFERREDWVRENLLAKPRLLYEGDGYREYVLLDRPEFFYDIHRIEFERSFEYDIEGRALTINLVEGGAVEITSSNGRRAHLAYLETMVIPAAAGGLSVVPESSGPHKLVVAFVLPGTGRSLPLNDPID